MESLGSFAFQAEQPGCRLSQTVFYGEVVHVSHDFLIYESLVSKAGPDLVKLPEIIKRICRCPVFFDHLLFFTCQINSGKTF